MKTSTVISLAIVVGVLGLAAYVVMRPAPTQGAAMGGGALPSNVSSDAADAAAIIGASGAALAGVGQMIESILGGIGSAAGNAASGAAKAGGK